ncbi:MAG TPA: FG-GAP-like repeat-containing protein, partial [Candidatus Acidoferrum sp.]|nr:FG-GAP-like repeat-containing protein [Candidatus Acidoferrum sp.]
ALAKLNLGIAFLAQQKSDEAKGALLEASRKLPSDPYGWYNLGLAYKDTADHEKAIEAFQHVTKIAPNEPDAFYFIGYLNTQLQKYDDAIAAYKSALAIFSYHASAEFGLAKAYQRKGDAENAKEHLQKFQKMTAAKIGTPFGAGYGDQGKFSQAEYSKNGLPKAPAAISVKFTPQTLSVGASSSACFLDYDGDGKPDLLLVSATQNGSVRLLHNSGDGKFADVTDASGIKLSGGGLGCAAGDYDNDGKTDFAVCTIIEGVHLFHNDGAGKFTDVTKTVGIKSESSCSAVTFVDYDHDGDLDLYVMGSARMRPIGEQPGMTGPAPGVRTTPVPNTLWRNNGNSTFTDVSKETGLGLDGASGGAVTSDFNNDRAIDFVLAGGAKGASILLNPREGAFQLLDGIDFAKEHLPPAIGVVAFDFDKDGWMDLAFTHAGAPGISLWRNKEGRGLERVVLPDFGWKSGTGIAAVDYDNDGWIDLVAVGEGTEPPRPLGSEGIEGHNGQVRLLRNLGEGKFADVTKETKLDAVKLIRPITIATANVSGNGAMDLVVTQAEGAPVLLKNEGAEKNGWIELDLKALNDNKSAIGTKVEVYAGELAQKFEVPGASGYLGQNALPVHAGLGSERGADVVRLLWPTGVPQDEIKLEGRKSQQVAELDRRGSSCPILFAWNGKEYEFIADMIGPGVVGHWVAPGERDVPDPTEYLKVSGKSALVRDGMLSFRFLEPMEETVYLDQVKLLAIDHPASYDVYPNERFAATPPFPAFGVVPTRNARPPIGAWDDRGDDVLPLLAKRDRKYVTDFDVLPFVGFAKLHWIELDLGEWNPRLPLRLILDGYTDYFTATSMYAADQAGVKVIPPYVEAQDANGKWVRVVDDMGFPAGLERTMVADLTGKIPAGTRRIRIANNLKIYWDAIRIDQTTINQSSYRTPEQKTSRVTPQFTVKEVPLARASLDFLGFPKEIRLTPASDTVYSYAKRSKTGPYARAAGNYTRYGDVKALLGAADDRFAIFSSGEGLELDFDARRLPTLPAGWVRDYFFMADGFEKDMDFYAAHAFTVEPLPKHGMKPYPYAAGQGYPSDAAHLGYELEYNTRSRSGKMPSDLRYDYVGGRFP